MTPEECAQWFAHYPYHPYPEAAAHLRRLAAIDAHNATAGLWHDGCHERIAALEREKEEWAAASSRAEEKIAALELVFAATEKAYSDQCEHSAALEAENERLRDWLLLSDAPPEALENASD